MISIGKRSALGDRRRTVFFGQKKDGEEGVFYFPASAGARGESRGAQSPAEREEGGEHQMERGKREGREGGGEREERERERKNSQ